MIFMKYTIKKYPNGEYSIQLIPEEEGRIHSVKVIHDQSYVPFLQIDLGRHNLTENSIAYTDDTELCSIADFFQIPIEELR